MKKLAFVMVVALGILLMWHLTRAADDMGGTTTLHGVLIDNMCGAKMEKKDNPEQAAAGHDKACAIKCGSSGYAVIHDKKMLKFDDNGNKLALKRSAVRKYRLAARSPIAART